MRPSITSFFLILLLVSSCKMNYHAECDATYMLYQAKSDPPVRPSLDQNLTQLFLQQGLRLKSNAHHPDQLEFTGSGKHHFVLTLKDTLPYTVQVRVHYTGRARSRSNPPYEDFLLHLEDTLALSYEVKESGIIFKSNRKP